LLERKVASTRVQAEALLLNRSGNTRGSHIERGLRSRRCKTAALVRQ